MRKLLLFLWVLTLPAWCKDWSHQGNLWKHSNGMSITFPADFQVEEQGPILNVSGKQGFVHYTVQGMQGEKNYKGWVQGERKSYKDGGVTPGDDSTKPLSSGLLARFMEGTRTTPEGIIFVIVSAAISKGQDYICLQMYYPKEREQDWTPLFQGTINSVTHPKAKEPK